MKKFFQENKVVLAIVVGALIVGGTIYFSPKNQRGTKDQISNLAPVVPMAPPAAAPAAGNAIKNDNCPNILELPDGAVKLATKIIDGDTFLIEGGYSVRILGIDADERDHSCYEPAKNRLEELILNKEVKLEKGVEDKDQWCRYLRYVFTDNQNIALELVKEGLAVARFSPEDVRYREEIAQVEKEARENKIGCKWNNQEIVQDKKTDFVWETLTPELTGLKVIGACQAGNYLGEEAIIEGKVAGTYRSKTNTIFLNFEKPYPNQCFTGVIFSSDQYKFVQNPEKYYSQKTVRVRGEIKEYEGKPEIILKYPSQIEIGK